jgi:transcriptional regulator with XRE-family HTH domain
MDPLLAQLARRRRELGLTQKALARRSRVSLATLQNVEADRANPSLRILRSLLDALELDLRATAEPSCWDALIGLGLPLAAIGPNTRPPRGTDLPRLIRQAARALERGGAAHDDGRAAEALEALLRAIRGHFPSVWRRCLRSTPHVARRTRGTPSARVIHLTRIARERLAEVV